MSANAIRPNDEFDIVPEGALPTGEAMHRQVKRRQQTGNVWRYLFISSLVIGIITLVALIYDVVDEAFTLIAVQSRISEQELVGEGRTLDDLTRDEHEQLLADNLSASQQRRFLRSAEAASLDELGDEALVQAIREQILREEIVGHWTLTQSLFNRQAINAEVAETFPDATLRWKAWVNWNFLTTPMSSKPEFAGVRTALLGSLYMIVITMLVAFPIGVGAAIYLEEYAADIGYRGTNPTMIRLYNALKWINQTIQVNINNLAGVPSIIYGMLGLAIFVRALEAITSGAVFGIVGNNGRTLISAALTMALLILPLLIINAQEAIRAVPRSLRQASYGLGATKWQTIWNQVLPVAFPGILTGTILSMSRAIGETAPLIVVGASTFIVTDPTGPFSKFTVLPIQIYNWTTRPQEEFRIIAAAAIIVLLVLLLSLNSLAIYLRNRFRRSF